MIFPLHQFHRPNFIAEISGNHAGSFSKMEEIIRTIADIGVKFVKIQTYKPSTITINSYDSAFIIDDPTSLWHGRRLWDVYQEAHTPWEWHKDLFDLAAELDIVLFSSPFDMTAVDLLEDLNCPIYKIASFEITDHILLRKVASTGKPIVMSTGMATLIEIETAISLIKENSNAPIALLKCTSSYPSPIADSNLSTIDFLHRTFGLPVGLSDHCLNPVVASTSIAYGVPLIEKHFKLEGDNTSIDSAFSLTPEQFQFMMHSCLDAFTSIGSPTLGGCESDSIYRSDRRSLYLTQNVEAGDTLSFQNVNSFRPGLGLPTSFFDVLKGRKFLTDIPKGTPLSLDHFISPE